jgi:hypothetical protein
MPEIGDNASKSKPLPLETSLKVEQISGKPVELRGFEPPGLLHAG